MRQPKTEAEWDAYLAGRWFHRLTDIPKTERQWDKYMHLRERYLGK
jgi:hypothetical protein